MKHLFLSISAFLCLGLLACKADPESTASEKQHKTNPIKSESTLSNAQTRSSMLRGSVFIIDPLTGEPTTTVTSEDLNSLTPNLQIATSAEQITPTVLADGTTMYLLDDRLTRPLFITIGCNRTLKHPTHQQSLQHRPSLQQTECDDSDKGKK